MTKWNEYQTRWTWNKHLPLGSKQIRNRNKQTDKQMDNTNSRFASWLKTMIISHLPEPKPYLLSSWINWPWDSGNPRH